MRFDRHQGKNAADIINYYSEKELIEIFREYGEENSAPKIARYIIEARKQKKIESTRELADIIEKANSYPGVKERIFQALRIEVNQELKNEEKAIKDGLDLLESDGTIFVISFHSLEDRIVKNIFRDESRDCICSDLICTCKHKRSIEILTKKPIVPSSEEIRENIRSRSAKARAAKKL
jgi:16S rRNA (cytosine1402-N4)-methyltransferase